MVDDEDLADLQEAVATLHVDGGLAGHLATLVEPMRGGFLLRRQVRIWLLLTRPDGTVDIDEDYQPFSLVDGLRRGVLTWPGDGVRYEVRWLSDGERRSAWLRYGIVEATGTYVARGARG